MSGLVDEVKAAEAKAAKLIADAEEEGRARRVAAERRAAEIMAETREATAREREKLLARTRIECEEETKRTLREGEAEADQLRKKAEKKLGAAVELVVERVIAQWASAKSTK